MTAHHHLKEMTPQAVQDALHQHKIVLIDVREPAEYAAERIHGALLFPLSTFDPADLPAPDTEEVVFHCGSGKRSAMAVEKCAAAGMPHRAHMTGGIQAWRASGLPTVTIDPNSGRVVDRQ